MHLYSYLQALRGAEMIALCGCYYFHFVISKYVICTVYLCISSCFVQFDEKSKQTKLNLFEPKKPKQFENKKDHRNQLNFHLSMER